MTRILRTTKTTRAKIGFQKVRPLCTTTTRYLTSSSAEELNESIAGLEEEGEQNDADGVEILGREDTGLDARRSERDLLLERLEEATDKNFETCSTPELRNLWKAYAEDQEASEEAEVIYPQVRVTLCCQEMF
jgi:hypothetical protein